MAIVTINNIKKSFGDKVALDIKNFSLEKGEILGLVGNNGAGKTTLFRSMLDLIEPNSGEVLLKDVNTAKSEKWKDYVGAFIDDGFLIDYLTPEEYFYFLGKVYGLTKKEVDLKLQMYISFMNDEILDKKKFIRNYSAGNKQKIGIIAALLGDPEIVILDEPFNFLDPRSQSLIKKILEEYNKEHSATIIISSHNLNHTIDISTRIILLESGVIIRDLRNENKSAEKELEDYFSVV